MDMQADSQPASHLDLQPQKHSQERTFLMAYVMPFGVELKVLDRCLCGSSYIMIVLACFGHVTHGALLHPWNAGQWSRCAAASFSQGGRKNEGGQTKPSLSSCILNNHKAERS